MNHKGTKTQNKTRPRALRTGRIEIAESKFHVIVRLWKTKSDLERGTDERKIGGVYQPWPYELSFDGGEKPRAWVAKRIGTLNYHVGNLGVGVLSHEVGHCLFDLLVKSRLVEQKLVDLDEAPPDIDEKLEEQLCYWLGYIVKDVVNWLNSVGAYNGHICCRCGKREENWTYSKKGPMCEECSRRGK